MRRGVCFFVFCFLFCFVLFCFVLFCFVLFCFVFLVGGGGGGGRGEGKGGGGEERKGVCFMVNSTYLLFFFFFFFRCIMRTLSVLLQVAADSRSHVQSINTRLDEMVSSTKDLRQRTVEVLATVEKENCLNIPQVSFLFFSLSFPLPLSYLSPTTTTTTTTTKSPLSKVKLEEWWKNMELFSPNPNKFMRLLNGCVLRVLL